MPQRESLPWLVVVGAVAIGFAIFLDAVLVGPLLETFTGLPGWRNSDLSYANEGMRMTEDFVSYLLLIVVAGISFGALLSARRRGA